MTPRAERALLEDRLELRVDTLETATRCGTRHDFQYEIEILRERVEAFLAEHGDRMQELREQERGEV